jgi:hypothetical protein
MVSRHTTTPVQDTTCARTHIRAPNLPRSTSPRHPVRVLAGQRTNARSCSPSFLRFRCGRRTPPAQDRGHLQRRADEAGTSPDCRVHFRSGSALGIALTGKIMTIFCLQSLFLFERKKSFLSDFSFFVSQIGSGSPPTPCRGRAVCRVVACLLVGTQILALGSESRNRIPKHTLLTVVVLASVDTAAIPRK